MYPYETTLRAIFREAGLPLDLPSAGVSEHRMKKRRKDPIYTITGPEDADDMVHSWQTGRIWTVHHPSEKGGAGYLLLIRDQPEEEDPGPWWVGQVVVRKDLRRKGIGEMLYARAAAWAKRQGGFQSGWITGEGPKQMWDRWVEEGKAVVLPNGEFRRTQV